MRLCSVRLCKTVVENETALRMRQSRHPLARNIPTHSVQFRYCKYSGSLKGTSKEEALNKLMGAKTNGKFKRQYGYEFSNEIYNVTQCNEYPQMKESMSQKRHPRKTRHEHVLLILKLPSRRTSKVLKDYKNWWNCWAASAQWKPKKRLVKEAQLTSNMIE